MTALKKLTKPLRETDVVAKFNEPVGKSYKPDKSRLVFSCSPPSSGSKDSYRTRIAFRVNIVKNGELTGTVLHEERRLRYTKPSIRSAAKVSCTCPDYLYTFALVNKAEGAHLGKSPMLAEVKGKGTGTPRNPDKIPGVCKHIRGLAHKLVRKQYIEG